MYTTYTRKCLTALGDQYFVTLSVCLSGAHIDGSSITKTFESPPGVGYYIQGTNVDV